MSSPTKEYFERREVIDTALRLIELPRKIIYKYELSPDTQKQMQPTWSAKERAKGYRVGTKMVPGNVVNFYRDDTVIGRIYFLEDPIRSESFDAAFSRIDAKLRRNLNVSSQKK